MLRDTFLKLAFRLLAILLICGPNAAASGQDMDGVDSASANSANMMNPTGTLAVNIQTLENPESGPDEDGSLSREHIELRLKELEENKELEEAAKLELVKRYRAIQDWMKIKSDAVEKEACYQAEINDAPRLLAEIKLTLSAPVATIEVIAPENATLAQIEQLATEAEAGFKTSQEVLLKKEDVFRLRLERKNEIAKLSEETKQRLEEARQQVTGSANALEEATPLTEAKRLELKSKTLALESQLSLYRVEALRHDAIAEVLPLARDVAKRDKTAREAAVAQWQTIVTAHRKRDSEKQAAEARRQVRESHPALRSLAEGNAELADQRKSLAESIARVGQQVQVVEKQVEQLRQQYQKADQRVRKAGHSTTVGLMLRRQKENLPDIGKCGQTLRTLQSDMPAANLAQIEVEEEREALGDVETAAAHVLSNLHAESDGNSEVEIAVREFLTTKFELLNSLANDYETYLNDLSDLEVSNGKLINQIQKSSDYIGENVLWIRSTDSIWIDDLRSATQGALSLAAPEHWLEVAKHCGLDAIQRPFQVLLIVIVFALIAGFHAKLRARMAALCSAKTGGSSLRFLPTVQAIGLAAIVATEWPLLMAWFGWRMSADTAISGLTSALGSALLYASVLLWVSVFVRHMLRPEGLAESHLGWSSFSAKLFRTRLWWLTVLGIPMAVITVTMQRFQDGEWADSLGRLSFILGMLLLAHFAHSVLNAKKNIMREAISKETGHTLARLRIIALWVGMGVPCMLAGLAIAGYYYSAQQVAIRWQATLGVTLALLFAYSVAARWCLVKRRNLAMEQARERKRLAAENSSSSETITPTQFISIADQQPDLSAIHEQLRYLLRHAAIVAMAVCSWFIWADVLPALKVLDRVVLWETTVEVTEMHEGPDGKLERKKEERPVTTTLRHLLFAVLMVLATFVIGRNLPALLEVTVLQRTSFDQGGRRAISVLLKYSVAITGLFLACRTMNFTWSSVQWLAAGMTVGLGFGLQEIFANFVSGLILLLERPIRVGDVITLGDVTGTVTNMQIRATTVTNWDRKELIVPNKDLITGRLLNWTLSDTTNRVVIKVGVAYQSDPQQARELIHNVVVAHPNVLREPEAKVTFEEFADSSLNLVARAYVSTMEVRLDTIHDLHILIHKALRDAGIEIAFPQRDIHVRGLEAAMLPKVLEQIRRAA